MRVHCDNGSLVLALNQVEGRALRLMLRKLGRAYRLKPGEVDPKIASVWYSARGCQSAGLSDAETQEWLQHLHEFKGANAARMEDWCRQLARSGEGQNELRMPLADASNLLAVLNDHRLMAAASHDIGEAEMTLEFLEGAGHFPQARQAALFEIHFLAWIIEQILQALDEPGAG